MKRNQFPPFFPSLFRLESSYLLRKTNFVLFTCTTRAQEKQVTRKGIFTPRFRKPRYPQKLTSFRLGNKKKVIILTHYPFPKIVHFLHRILAFIKIAARCTQRVLHVSGWEKRGGTALASQRKNGKGLLGKGNDSTALFIRRILVIRPSRRELVEKSILTGDPRCTMEEEFATGGEIRGGERAASRLFPPFVHSVV